MCVRARACVRGWLLSLPISGTGTANCKTPSRVCLPKYPFVCRLQQPRANAGGQSAPAGPVCDRAHSVERTSISHLLEGSAGDARCIKANHSTAVFLNDLPLSLKSRTVPHILLFLISIPPSLTRLQLSSLDCLSGGGGGGFYFFCFLWGGGAEPNPP